MLRCEQCDAECDAGAMSYCETCDLLCCEACNPDGDCCEACRKSAEENDGDDEDVEAHRD